MDERRKYPRQRTYKGGRINPDRGPGVDCIIRNMSDVGVCIDIGSGLVPQDSFHLVIKPEFLTRHCRVVWRRQQKIGVQFV